MITSKRKRAALKGWKTRRSKIKKKYKIKKEIKEPGKIKIKDNSHYQFETPGVG